MSNNGGHRVAKEILEVIRVNKGKKVKWRYEFKSKLILFTYYLELFLALSYIIKLFLSCWIKTYYVILIVW